MRYLKYPLDIIHVCIPSWSYVSSFAEDGKAFDIKARPILDGGLAGDLFSLTVKNESGKIVVLETNPGLALPGACPERHINRNGSFCIGLNAGDNIVSRDDAQQWWRRLEDFFKCQRHAKKFRRWPPGRWLSHGDAAIDHLAMESIAKELGWEEEVRLAIEYKEGWLADLLPRHHKNSNILVNQRLPCPRECLTHKGKRSYRIIRRKCPHKHQVSMLVKHESSRRQKEAEFVREFLAEGFTCCGTMDQCPFAI